MGRRADEVAVGGKGEDDQMDAWIDGWIDGWVGRMEGRSTGLAWGGRETNKMADAGRACQLHQLSHTLACSTSAQTDESCPENSSEGKAKEVNKRKREKKKKKKEEERRKRKKKEVF